jgi:hypothetical protein
MNFWDRTKQKAWRHIYRFFPQIQKFFLKLGVHEKGRQKFHLGWLAPNKTLEELKQYLHEEWGFGNHFVAWTDDGQVLSWRKLVDFKDQYHLRVFEDGEIRGHFELTPEAHPIEHFIEKGELDRKNDFVKFLGDFMVQEKYISHLVMDPNAYNPDSEITIDQMLK